MIGKRPHTAAPLAALLVAALASTASAQLRIVQYNTATGQNPGTQTARSGMDFILRAIGDEVAAGVKKPIDVLAVQEQYTTAISTQSIVDVLNSIYGPGTYARSFLNGDTSDSLRRAGAPALIYNTTTVQLVSSFDDTPGFLGEKKLGNVGTSDGAEATPAQQPRSSMRYRLRPVGYDSAADFWIYSMHWKSDTGTGNNNRRLVEAEAVRADSDALGQGAHVIYAGDFNIQTSNSTAYQHMLSAGNGQAFDPINTPGSWNNNSSAAIRVTHTQSPAVTSRFSGQTTGGMDDRFDFQLVTDELRDNEGMSYISGTYRAFGNNGTTFNLDIDNGANTYPFNGIVFSPGATRSQLLTNLASVSDHLPVVADYQIPAKMDVQVAAIPSTVTLEEVVPITVTIENIAPTLAVGGADELDYILSVTGDLTGGAMGSDPAMGGGHDHTIFLNTSTLGMKSGVITVSTTSQGAANALFTLPVSFTVGGEPTFLAADFDNSGMVDGDDLAAWAGGFGLESGAAKGDGDADLNGAVDGADLLAWQQQLGSLPPAVATQAAIPEPASLLLAAFSLGCAGRFRRPGFAATR